MRSQHKLENSEFQADSRSRYDSKHGLNESVILNGEYLEGNHKIEKLSHSFWSLSIYNLTGRDNPFSVFFDVKDGEIKGKGSQLIVFGNPVPTLSYNFKF